MEFWGVEVKSGQLLDVDRGEGGGLNIAQASLGEIDENARESVVVHIIVKCKKFVVATLYPKLLPTENLNLVFYDNFKISHNLKNGSVYFIGTKLKKLTPCVSEIDRDSDDDEFPDYSDINYEVVSGQTLHVKVAEGKIVHLTKASLQINREGIEETSFLHVIVDGKRLVAGKLNTHRRPQQDVKLSLDKDFQISHTLSNGIVCFCGYLTAQTIFVRTTSSSDDDDDEEEIANKEEGNKVEEGLASPAREIETE